MDEARVLTDVSCAGERLCVADDGYGYALTYNGERWSAPDPVDPKGAASVGRSTLSCPSAEFCMALYSSEYFTYGGSALSAPQPIGEYECSPGVKCPDDLAAVSCGSESFCMGVARQAQIWDGQSWLEPQVMGSEPCSALGYEEEVGGGSICHPAATSVSCPTESFCMAVDENDGVAFHYDGASWSKVTMIDPGPSGEVSALNSVSCASEHFCAAVDGYGRALIYEGTHWSKPSQVDATHIFSVSCPAVGLCRASDFNGDVLTYAGGSWSGPEPAYPGEPLYGISCPTITFCVAVGGNGLALTYSSPVSISPPTLAPASVGSAYSASLSASGGSAPYTFSVLSGSTPEGLSLSPEGVISGTPTSAETASFTVLARDSSKPALIGTREYSLTVSPGTGTTATQLSCSPSTVAPSQTGVCTATVTDSSTGSTAPTGSVSFSTLGKGSFSASSCTLAAIGATGAGCSVTYTPAAEGTQELIARYGGDRAHEASTGEFDLEVAETALRASPNHVWANGHETTTLTLTSLAGRSLLAGHPVRLSFSPSAGVEPVESSATQTANFAGEASWKVSSTKVATVTFTATDVEDAKIDATAKVFFQRHKVVVQLLGINSSLQCSAVSPVTCSSPPGIDKFAYLRAALLTNPAYDFKPSDLLWYSYDGGRVDSSTGAWIPNSYGCLATGQSYRKSLAALQQLIVGFGRSNPNTEIYLVGHSQGGLIALQELGYLSELPESVRVAGIITLDSPLGGTPELDAWLASESPTVCWKGAAVPEMGAEYLSTEDHLVQGSAASLMCTFFACPDVSGATTNFDAVHAFASQTTVTTLGNSDDAVYDAGKCNIDVPRFDTDNRSTMVIAGAQGGMAPLGGNSPTPHPLYTLIGNPLNPRSALISIYDECVSNSHAQITAVDAGLIASIIGGQPTPGASAEAAALPPSTATPVGAQLEAKAVNVALYVPAGAGGQATLTLQSASEGKASAAGHRARRRARAITIGRAHLRLRAGHLQTIHVKLDAAGERLARRGALHTIRATITSHEKRFSDELGLRHQRIGRRRRG